MAKRGPKSRYGQTTDLHVMVPEALIEMLEYACIYTGANKTKFVAVAIARAIDRMAVDKEVFLVELDQYDHNRRLPYHETWLRGVPEFYLKK